METLLSMIYSENYNKLSTTGLGKAEAKNRNK